MNGPGLPRPRADRPQVVVLNGGSSSGKSSLATALVDLLPGTWLRVSVDSLIEMLPPGFDRVDGGLAIRADGSIETGPQWRRVEHAWMRSVATLAAEVGVVVEDGFLSGPAAQARWREALAGLEVLWVGVRCDPGVAEARELGRGDRVVGMARLQADAVHEGITYDLEVDTSLLSADAAAGQVATRITTS